MSPDNRKLLGLWVFVIGVILAFFCLRCDAQQAGKKDQFALPATRQAEHKKMPVVGKLASSFVKHHGRLANFLGGIDFEWDKPHKLRRK